MSGSNNNPLLPQGPPQPAPAQPQQVQTPMLPGEINHPLMARQIRSAMRGRDMDTVIRHRDRSARGLQYFAELASSDNPKAKDVENYIGKLTGDGELTPMEAFAVLRSMPKNADAAALKQWSKMMLAAIVHAAVDAHAAYPVELYPPKPAQPPQAQQPQEQPQAPEEDEDAEAAE